MSGSLANAVYFAAFLAIAISGLDYIGAIWPFAPGTPSWRYGAVGIFAGFVVTPLIGIVFGLTLATSRGDHAWRRLFGMIAVLFGGASLIGLLSFGLDFAQARRELAPDATRVADIGAAKAAVKLLLFIVASSWLGISGLRQRGDQAESGSRQPSPVVVGR